MEEVTRPAGASTEATRSEIVATLGFFPPFFGPATDSPPILEELWRQTQTCYLYNPLPMLFKEQLAALLGRYCKVPYCLICHSASLRPLGMSASAVLSLLEQPPLQVAELAQKVRDLDIARLKHWPVAGTALDQCLLHCGVAIFLDQGAAPIHQGIRRVLSSTLYDALIVFIAYNRVCLTWAEAHPELTANDDLRVTNNLAPLLAAAPGLADFFANYAARTKAQASRRSTWLSQENDRLLINERALRREAEASEAHARRLLIQLEQERTLREKFVATLSHDLRSPLAAARLRTQRIQKRGSDAVFVCKTSAAVVETIDRADKMIQELLNSTRLRFEQRPTLDKERVDLHKVINLTVREMQDIHGEHRFEFSSPAGPVFCQCESKAIRRVLENLLTNALKYGEENGRIRVSLSDEPTAVSVGVRNQGLPISAAEQKAIFNPFARSKSAARGSQEGWGIGLSFVHDMVTQEHQGTIEVRSEANFGTEFTFKLPKTPAAQAGASTASAT